MMRVLVCVGGGVLACLVLGSLAVAALGWRDWRGVALGLGVAVAGMFATALLLDWRRLR